MLSWIIKLIVHSPFYPHWLDFRNQNRASIEQIPYFKGKVLETGSGNSEKKQLVLQKNKKVSKYTATDYSSWDENFEIQKKQMNAFGAITQILYGTTKDPSKLDMVCSALDLPFKNNSFDTYCSFEVLEHINDPVLFFSEAHRVLVKGGYCIISMPFLYREHGGIDMDFQRFTRGGFRHMAQRIGFDIVEIKTYSYFGTTFASLTNQFIIRRILEGNVITKAILLPLSPMLFFLTNSIGYVIELFDKDERFAAHYHVIMKKK